MAVTADNRPAILCLIQYVESLSNGSMTVYDVLEKAHQHGLAGVELRREQWPNLHEEREQMRSKLDELGLIATFATFNTLFSKDEAGQKQMLNDIVYAQTLDVEFIRIFAGDVPQDTNDPRWAGAREAVEVAERSGMKIALENISEAIGGKLADIRRVLDHFPTDTLGTNIDIGNYALNGEDVPEAIRTVGERAIGAHLKDRASGDNTYLGGGDLPMAAIFTELEKLPQRVIYCYEFNGGDDPDERIRKSQAYIAQFRRNRLQAQQ